MFRASKTERINWQRQYIIHSCPLTTINHDVTEKEQEAYSLVCVISSMLPGK